MAGTNPAMTRRAPAHFLRFLILARASPQSLLLDRREPGPSRLDEGADFIRILGARRALDAGGYVDRAGEAQPDGLRDILGRQPARQQPRLAGMEIARQPPVEGDAVAARQN